MQKKISILFIALAFILVLVNPDTVKEGMLDGINICLTNLIPSIFPLFFLIRYLSEYISPFRSAHIRKFFERCGLESGTESLFFLSLISGYPVGAVTIQDLTSKKVIRRETACRLMGFCNNAGPAFIFGLSSTLFEEKWLAWIIWGIQILSALFVAIVLPKPEYTPPIKAEKSHHTSAAQIMFGSIKSISLVCGWVIIFRALITLMELYVRKPLPQFWLTVIRGILELTNGSISLSQIPNNALRFILFNIFLSFGGLCVWMQILSSTGELITKTFFYGKALHILFSALLSVLLQRLILPDNLQGYALWIVASVCIFGIGMLCYYLHSKKTVAKPGLMMYNAGKTIRNEA